MRDHRDDVIGMYIETFQKEPLTEERKKALYYGGQRAASGRAAVNPGAWCRLGGRWEET